MQYIEIYIFELGKRTDKHYASDHRSYVHNLKRCENGIPTHGLYDIGAALYQLSY